MKLSSYTAQTSLNCTNSRFLLRDYKATTRASGQNSVVLENAFLLPPLHPRSYFLQIDAVEPSSRPRGVGPDPSRRKLDGSIHGYVFERAVDPALPRYDNEGDRDGNRQGGCSGQAWRRGNRWLGGELLPSSICTPQLYSAIQVTRMVLKLCACSFFISDSVL